MTNASTRQCSPNFVLTLFRNLLGEELEHLGAKELDQLEHQLDVSLKQIRSTKVYIQNLVYIFMLKM
jgi:hypothetical protein